MCEKLAIVHNTFSSFCHRLLRFDFAIRLGKVDAVLSVTALPPEPAHPKKKTKPSIKKPSLFVNICGLGDVLEQCKC